MVREHAGVANPMPAFDGKAATLTHATDATPDFHPTDAGHRAIADAFTSALAQIQ